MAELLLSDGERCKNFFLYDGSRVRGEGDLTREGICYFYPEQTPLDKQELLCGQLAGVGRCISEISLSPVRTLQLRNSKFAIRMSEDFLWALGCSMEVPTVSVCDLLDELISLFCFYNGPVRRIYQLNNRELLAARWAQYLSHLLSGSSKFNHTFSRLKTIDPTNIQRKIGPSTFSSSGGAVSSTKVFLTSSELHYLQSSPVNKDFSHLTSHKDAPKKKTQLSRTLSDTPSTNSDLTNQCSSLLPQKVSLNLDWSESEHSMFSSALGTSNPLDRSPQSHKASHTNRKPSGEEQLKELEQDIWLRDSEQSIRDSHHPTNKDTSFERVFDTRGCRNVESQDDETAVGDRGGSCGSAPPFSGAFDSLEDDSLIPMMLYMHRVKELVLALLVEPRFLSDTASMEEVYHSSLASLNGLEAHLRAICPGAPVAPELYIFAHFDLIQHTLTSNLSGRPGRTPEHSFVRATSLLHSHFCNTETLQEAIIRSAGTAVYGTRSVAQETFYQQLGPSLRNSGIPNHQDSAFSLPSKARHRLLKHGVNLL
ncbi:BLOC-3 complex member HPS4 isoform X2 [Gouania willdenowi]|uniref:BLOC-3 complex member HPS4 isoform X2 n=1 Tax=Gouania willdenowi TaxID=441366 RepID=UPI001056DA81|nr:Hermansky-Pudlak syndrome 4 protein isoform X2 [Gouania willdenowi]